MSKETKKIGGFELPPLLEWHTFQLTQLASTAEYFTSELKNVENEYLTKFLTELEKEDYKSSKISGRIIRETKRIVEKTIGDLKDLIEQAEGEWKERFHSSSSSSSVVASCVATTSEQEAVVEGSEISKTNEPITHSEIDDLSDISDSDGNCTTIYDSSSPDKAAKEHEKEEDSGEEKSFEISDDETTSGVSKSHAESNENQSSVVDEINETVEEEESQENIPEVAHTAVDKTQGPSSRAEIVAASPPTTRSRAVRSPSPAETVFAPPASTRSKAARSPSPAETVFAPPASTRSRAARSPSPAETVVAPLSSSKGSRGLRPPSPAETVVASTSSRGSKAARSPSPTETVFLGPPKGKLDESSSAPTKVPRSRIRSPSPAETVLMNRKSPAASDSEEEGAARRSVLAKESVSPQKTKERKSRSSRRSPSPAETVLFGATANQSDSEEDDAKARQSVLSRVKEESSVGKPSVNAPFKKPKVVASKLSENLEEDDEVPSTSSYSSRQAAKGSDGNVRGHHPNGVTAVKGTELQDWKLRPNSSYILVERLPEIILDRLKTHKVVYVTDSKVKKKRKINDALQMAIKRLENFCPIVKRSESRDGKGKSSRSGSKKKAAKKISSDDDEDIITREDASTGDGSDEDEPVIKRSLKPHPPVILDSGSSAENGELSEGSEADDLMVVDNSSKSSEDDDSDAKRRVLKGSRKAAAVKSSDEDKQLLDSGDDKKKKKKKFYYTPKVNVNLKDTDESDSDDFVVTKKRRTGPARGKIRSDSEESSTKDRNNKLEKRYSTEELSSDSAKSDDGSRTLKSSRRRSPSVESRNEKRKKTKKKKRRRVKLMSDSEDSDSHPKKKSRKKDDEVVIDSDSDVEEITEDAANKGRKDIRKIISKKDLQKETRKAEEEEEKRKKRIAERQAQFNGVVTLPEGERLAELILDMDPKTKEPLIKVDPIIVAKLKPHQAKGILFMWQACFESVEQFQKPENIGSGCILAHCMGLGKTLQTVAFLHTVMTSEPTKEKIRTALVICPLNTVTNWTNEVRMWTRDADRQVTVHKLYDEKNVQARVDALRCWQRRGGVGIIHYDSFRALVEGKKIKKHLKDSIMECLADPGPDIVVCDEGHVFKNEKSKMSLAVNKIKTRRRVVLTGTPLQNNLLEYHCMMQFVKPNLLGSKKEFSNRFVNPITNGQHKDSTPSDVKIMKKRAHVLHKLLDGCVQRLDYNVLVPYLPPKYEYAVFIKMTDIQTKLYLHYLNSIKHSSTLKDLVGHGQLLKHSAMLAKIYCHPRALELKHLKNNKDDDVSSDSAGSLKDFIDDESDPPAYESDSDIECLIDESTFPNKSSKKNGNGVVKKEADDSETPAVVDPANDPEALSTDIIEKGGDWWSKFFKSKSDMKYMEHSNKMVVLFEILRICETIQDKVLVFSQYIYSLDMIEEFLEALDQEAKQNDVQTTFPPRDNPNVSRWRKNIEYFRIDGSVKAHDRQRNCDTFNIKTDTSRAKLFLISTKAGGLGINLIGANRVVIFDASWNPSQDMQSIFRVFRFGQTKPCYIYRLLAEGTIEEKIYNRQVVKLSLSCRVVDEHQIERHFTFDDIAKMFEYNPDEKIDRPTPDLPKDRLLADLLMSHKDIIDNYHEHDSLLQNQVDQGLTEDERKAAWDEYQNEKNRVVILPSANVVTTPDSNVDIMQAYDKMKAKIRQMYPNVPEPVIGIYIKRIQQEMLELRVQTSRFHEVKGRLDMNTAVEYQRKLNMRKTAISNYFSIPGFLSTAMKPEVEKFMQQQRINIRNGVGSILQQQQQPGPSGSVSFGDLARHHYSQLANSQLANRISEVFRMNSSVGPTVQQQQQQPQGPGVPVTMLPQQLQQPSNGPNVFEID